MLFGVTMLLPLGAPGNRLGSAVETADATTALCAGRAEPGAKLALQAVLIWLVQT
jgi:hypothetical protein